MKASTAIVRLALAALVCGATSAPALAQSKGLAAQDLSSAPPGRDPKQPIDTAYTRKLRGYTTEPFFLSPLIDYLPASRTVAAPNVGGDIAGSPHYLPYSKEVYDYMRALAKASPRVKVYSIGTTEEGREMIAVAVASEGLWAKMDQNKAALAKLGDPRMIKMNDSVGHALASTAAPVYYITGTIHSTESGAPTALMELAYRLAVDESPYIRNIRENVITLITPVVEVDGRDREVDLVRYRMAHPNDPEPSLIYWGHYVAHDNNRDAMGLTLKLSQNVLNTYLAWNGTVLHDLHESESYLYDNTIGDGPYNAWLDPLLTNEWQMIGWNNVQEMTRFGMPGVYAHGDFDTWSPGYLMFMAATHNGISRLYETQGNGGSPETREVTANASRTWYKQNPPLARVRWNMRDNNNYEETGLLVSLSYVADNRRQLMENFYEKSKRSVLKPRNEGPAAYVLPADDAHPGEQAELLRVMQRQHVEIVKATSAFTVTFPAQRPAGGGRGAFGGGAALAPAGAGAGAGAAAAAGAGRGGRAGGAGGGRGNRGGGAAGGAVADATPAAPAPGETRTFPAGSYIIRMDQPYSRIADALLDYQYWAPNDPQKRPYDDTGWTFPEGFGTQAIRVVDTTVLNAPATAVADVTPAGGVSGSGTVFLINNTADNGVATLRYELKDADMQAAEEAFDVDGTHYNRGSYIIKGVDAQTLSKDAKDLGLKAVAVSAAPTVSMHPIRAARVALVHSWNNTQTEGWWREAFDFNKVPYDYIAWGDLAKIQDIKSKYDVIVMTPSGGNAEAIVDGTGTWGQPVAWKNSADFPNIGTWAQTDNIGAGLGWDGVFRLQNFVKQGGVLIASHANASLPTAFGFTYGVTETQGRTSRVVGSLLRTQMGDAASPISYGMTDNLAMFSENGESLTTSNTRVLGNGGGGGRGGGGGAAPAGAAVAAGGGRAGGGGNQRATGRGTPDEPDVVQGRPDYDRMVANGVTGDVGVLATDNAAGGGGGRGGRGGGGAANNNIPSDMAPRVILRFTNDPSRLLVSGLLDGGSDLVGKPVVVDQPFEKGHVVLFATNPMYRGETVGAYPLVFNTIMNFDNLNVGGPPSSTTGGRGAGRGGKK